MSPTLNVAMAVIAPAERNFLNADGPFLLPDDAIMATSLSSFIYPSIFIALFLLVGSRLLLSRRSYNCHGQFIPPATSTPAIRRR